MGLIAYITLTLRLRIVLYRDVQMCVSSAAPTQVTTCEAISVRCSTIETTCYEPRTLTLTYSGDIGLNSFVMNMSDEADTFVVWCMRRFEKGKARSKYGVHPSVSK